MSRSRSKAVSGGIIRVARIKPATIRYGSAARSNSGPGGVLISAASSRLRRRTAATNTAPPSMAAPSVGSSGPVAQASSAEMVKKRIAAAPAHNIALPARRPRSAAAILTSIKAMIQPTLPLSNATANESAAGSSPVSASSGTIGVPMAPNGTATAQPATASNNAAGGENPAATSSGAASAIGVPKPAAPSRKQAKNQAISKATMRGSSLNPARARPNNSVAPVRTWNSWMHNAGKMIQRIVADWNNASRKGPVSPERLGAPKTVMESTIASAAAALPAAAADQRAPINRVSSNPIGVSASATSIGSGGQF